MSEQDRTTHGFALENTDEGIWRRMAIGRTADGHMLLKLESRGPMDMKISGVKLRLSATAFAMLTKLVDEANTSMSKHPVHEDFGNDL